MGTLCITYIHTAKKMAKVEEASSKLSMAMDAKKRAAEKLELLQAKRKKIDY